MRRTVARIFVTGASLALCLIGTASKSTAEPLSGPGEQGSGAAAPTAMTAESKEVADAVAKFQERDFDGALKLLREAVKKNADLPPAHVIMAEFFANANLPAGVRNALERAVMDSPDDPEAYVIMGDLAVRERRVAEAEMLYPKAQSLMAKFKSSAKRKGLLQPRIYSGLAAVDEIRERWADAQKQLAAALRLEPKNATFMQRLARSLFQQKKPEGALDMLKQAASVDPEVLTPEAILAQMYEQAGDRENAKKWMAAALLAAPNDLRTHLIVGQWDLETGDVQGAKNEAAAALRINPKSIDAQILCGVIALFDKDYPAAERYFEAALIQSPRNFAASNNLALALIEQKEEAKKKRAVEYALDNVQKYPKLAEAASTYGWVQYKLGRLEDAEKAFQAAVSGGQINPDTAYYIARLSYDRGREALAKQWLEVALKSTGPFAMRQEAAALLEQLKK